MNAPADPTFPGLSGALDPARVRDLLAEAVPECRAGQLAVEDVRILNVQYRPRAHGMIQYQVKFRRKTSGRSVSCQLAGRLTVDGEPAPLPSVEQKAAYAALRGRALSEPVVRLDPIGMLAYAYPCDPGLPGLVNASTPRSVRTHVARMWRGRPVRVTGVAVDSLGYTPGARAALSYEILSEDRETGVPEVRHLVGKIDAQRSAAELFARSWAVWQAAGRRIRLAAPVGYLPRLNLWLQERVDGIRLADLVGVGNVYRPARQTAVFLSVLHGLALPLRSRRAASHHVKAVRRWGGTIAAIRPGDRQRVLALRDRLATELEGRARITGPVHGDLHPANVLVAGERVTLIDLDNMSLGDRLMDVGRFMSALRVSSLRVYGNIQGMSDVAESFLDCYLRRTGEDERRARLFEAASLIISAGTGFRLQREGWDEASALLLDEAQRVLDKACAQSSVAVPSSPKRARALPAKPASSKFLPIDWALDEQFMRAALDPYVREGFGAEVLRCTGQRKTTGARRDRLQYTVTGERGGERIRILLDGILWHDNRGGRVHRRLEAAHAAFDGNEAAPLLPRPVAYVRDLGLQLLEVPQGRPFTDCLSGADGPGAVDALAGALGAFHRARVAVERSRPLASELRGLRSRIEALSGTEVGALAGRLLDRAAARLTDEPGARVLTLRHLSPRRLVWSGARVGLTELDDLAMAHPFVDAADFVGRLTLAHLSEGGDAALPNLMTRFRQHYTASMSGSAELPAFEAAALIRHACVEARRGSGDALALRLLAAADERLMAIEMESS